ncbi:hypothetical protein DFS33DRAFT_1380280 [Desarmillaria ectypa]|nr:hypothetical protein DFS33DRAFT_1380280 [Desarmillaria ectypa]
MTLEDRICIFARKRPIHGPFGTYFVGTPWPQSPPDTVSRRTIYQLIEKKGITYCNTSIQRLINASFNDSPRVLAKLLSVDPTQADVASCLGPTEQSESPVQMSSLGSPVRMCCNGFCPLPAKKRASGERGVYIIMQGSSADMGSFWWIVLDSGQYKAALIKKCSEESYPLLASLMLHVKFVHFTSTFSNQIGIDFRYEIFKNFCQVFEEVQRYSEKLRLWQEDRIRRGLPTPCHDNKFSDMNFHQDPQLSSPEPLDMKTVRWNP